MRWLDELYARNTLGLCELRAKMADRTRGNLQKSLAIVLNRTLISTECQPPNVGTLNSARFGHTWQQASNTTRRAAERRGEAR